MTAPLDKPLDDLGQALARVTEYAAEYTAAVKHKSEADSARCAALNRLNEAQRKLDALIESMKEAAPLDSDWRRGHRNSDLPYPGPNLAQVQP